MSKGSQATAIVVGAGIVGAACAEALASDGFGVTVIESRYAAAGATSGGMGHVVAMDDSGPQLALTDWSVRLWKQRRFTDDCEIDDCGTIWVAADSAEMDLVAKKAKTYAARSIPVETLDPKQLREAEPGLREGLAGALWVQSDLVVYPPAVARHLLAAARSAGAILIEGAEVTEIGPGWAIVSGERYEADILVNAAGGLAPRLMPALPITPRKGHLVITDRYPGAVRHQVVELGYLRSAHTFTAQSVAFNVQPRQTGQVLIGSSRELVGWDAAINHDVLRSMLSRAFEYMPGLRVLDALRTWTAFRPATPDKLPLIGQWEPRLLVAAGHEGLGITTSLATGRIIADIASEKTPRIDVAPFDPRRQMAAHE